MRLAVITDEVSQDLEEALSLADRERFDGVEIRSVWDRAPRELTERDAGRIGAATARHGLELAAFASSVFKCRMPSGRRALRRTADELRQAVTIAGALGTRRLRVFSFCRDGPPDVEAAAGVLGGIVESVPTFGLELLIETGTSTHTPTGQHVAALLRQIENPPHVRALWDPGNSVFSGFDRSPFPAGLDALDGCLGHIHVKDPAGRRGYVPLGDGDLPWPDIVAELRRRRYARWISLETHWRPARRLSAQDLFRPHGERFSEGGLAATAASMRVLARWCGEDRER